MFPLSEKISWERVSIDFPEDISESEVTNAAAELKKGREAPRPDVIPIEIIQLLGQE